MGKFSLRRYEDQAKVSVAASLVAVVTLLALIVIVVRRIVWSELAIFYGGPTRMGIMSAVAVTLLLSVIGFGFGINSVGQRRNEKQGLSWLGFFVSAAVLVLTIGVSAFVHFRGDFIGH